MVKSILQNLHNAKTKEDIISQKEIVIKSYNDLYKEIEELSILRTNYDDIEMLYKLEMPMCAYFGFEFYEECGIPFLKKYNPKTIKVMELSSLFYIIQTIILLEKDFFNNVTICALSDDMYTINGMKSTSLIDYAKDKNLFSIIWQYFVKLINIPENGREILITYYDESNHFYIVDDEYEFVLDVIYENYKDSNYSKVIDRILGIYNLRFTKMKYILEYQPIFIKVIDNYICTLYDKKEKV